MLDTPLMEYLREFNMLSVLVRLALSALLSGLVGFERELKGQPAGLRTHMLVCLGSALAILTNLYITQMYALADPTRIAAQVVSGIGFLGAGAIVVTGRLQRQVRGLTTAAGLWSSACMGIALGAGFYEGALISFGLIMFIIALLRRIDRRIHSSKQALQLYVESTGVAGLSAVVKELRRLGCIIESTEINSKGAGSEGSTAFLVLRYPVKTLTEDDLIAHALEIDGVLVVDIF